MSRQRRLQTAVAGAALVNGGKLIEPTFLPRTRAEADKVATPGDEADRPARTCASCSNGTASTVPAATRVSAGFNVGGKTGTADKVVNGRYAHDKNFNAFLAAFPMDNPQYVVLTFCDEPKDRKGQRRGSCREHLPAPMVKEIITPRCTHSRCEAEVRQ